MKLWRAFLPVREVVGGLLAVLTWGLLFLAGIVVDSTPYRASAAAAKHFEPSLLVTWFVAFTCYTVTNALLLACLASLIGEVGARFRPPESVLVPQGEHPYLAALTRGFFIYLVAISGIVITMDSPLASPSPQQYVRLAGVISLVSFAVAYNPELFSALLTRAAKRLHPQDESSDTEEKPLGTAAGGGAP